jgi:phage gp29-like protein
MTTRKKTTSQPSPAKSAPANKGTGGLNIEQAIYDIASATSKFPDPDDMLRKAGMTRALLRPLESDEEVSQCLETRREALVSTPWRLEPQEDPNHEWLHAEIERVIETLIRSCFNAVPYGYSVSEAVYEQKEDGKFGIKFISEKPFEWFEPKADGSLIYRSSKGDVICDPRKYLVTVRSPTYRQPYGEALFTRLYWTVFFKIHGRKFWAKFLERFGEPLLIGQVADQEKFVSDVVSLGLAAGLPVQPGDQVSHIAVSQAGEFDRFDSNLVTTIQKVVLGQTLTSQMSSSGGSFAAAQVHNQVRMDKRNSDIRLTKGTVQKLINTLLELNGLPLGMKFVMADDTGIEMDRATRDALLVEKGVIKLTKSYILDRYDFRDDDIIVVDSDAAVDTPVDTPPEPKKTNAKMAATGATPRFTSNQMVIEDAVSEAMRNAQQPISNDVLQSAIFAATSPEDLEERLAILLRDIDIDSFREVYERAIFAADLIGYAHAQVEQK